MWPFGSAITPWLPRSSCKRASSIPSANAETSDRYELRRELELAGDIGSATTLAQAARRQARSWEPSRPSSPDPRLLFSGQRSFLRERARRACLRARRCDERRPRRSRLHLLMGEITSGMCLLDGVARTIFVRRSTSPSERARRAFGSLRSRSAASPSACSGSGYPRTPNERTRAGMEASSRRSGYSPRMAIACEMIHATRFDEAQELFLQEIGDRRRAGSRIDRGHGTSASGRSAAARRRLGRGTQEWSHGGAPRTAGSQRADRHRGFLRTGHDRGVDRATRDRPDDRDRIARCRRGDARISGSRSLIGPSSDTWRSLTTTRKRAVEVLEPSWQLMLESGLGDLSIFPTAQLLGEALVAVGRLEDSEAISATLAGLPRWCASVVSRDGGTVSGVGRISAR